MNRIAGGRAGVTLAELLIAVALSSLALIALAALTGMAARQQVAGGKSLTAQMGVSAAFKAIERELSEATLLLTPAVWGVPSGVLEACANAAGVPNSGPPVPLDPGKPMRFFAFCSAGDTLYYHVLPGCPAAYVCGTEAALSFGDEARPVSASFRRPSVYSGVVEVSLKASSGEAVSSRESSFVVAAAAGRNQ